MNGLAEAAEAQRRATRRVAAIARATERERITRRLMPDRCSSCGKPLYPVGQYRICRNLSCARLVEGTL